MFEQSSVEKERAPELRFAHLAPGVWDTLGQLERTGWVQRGIANPETVQEHIISLRELAAQIDGLSVEEQDGLFDMLEIHDWPEAIHGDEVILSEDQEELMALLATKFEKEKLALTSICENLGDTGTEIMNLWLRFEESNDPAAVFGRQLDKYQAIEKALEYEIAQGIACFREFFEYDKKKIQHPILVARMEKLESRWNSFNQSK